VFHLNIGQPDLETPKVMRDRLKSVDPVIAYSPSAGTPQYLKALSGYYDSVGLKVEAKNLIATTGGSEAVFFAFLCLAEAGDEAIVAEPFYTNYSSFAAMTGVTLVAVQCRGEEGFHLPPRDAFESVLTSRTRFVLLCNPNNPTGTVYSREEIQRVADFCRDHDLFFVSDEVYREFVYDGLIATSALDLEGLEDRVVVVDSLSKRFSACGIRLGCFVSRNEDVIAAANRAAQGRLSPPGLAQALALGMSEIGPDYYSGVRAEYQKRRDVIFEELSRIENVFLRKPEGAFYVVARLPLQDSDDFARFLLRSFRLKARR
jgi:aspartate aminotransferase